MKARDLSLISVAELSFHWLQHFSLSSPYPPAPPPAPAPAPAPVPAPVPRPRYPYSELPTSATAATTATAIFPAAVHFPMILE